MKVLGIAGSLRRGSYNRGLLEAARQLALPSMTIERFDLDAIPLYNADLDADGVRPAEVERLKKAKGARGVDAPRGYARGAGAVNSRSVSFEKSTQRP